MTEPVSTIHSNETIRDVYVSICRDSGFQMNAIKAVHLTAKVLDISALMVWMTMNYDMMVRLADGTHDYYETEAFKSKFVGSA